MSADVVKTKPLMKIETVTTGSFAMDYFRFGHGEDTLVILPGLSVQSVMDSADVIAESYQLLTDDFTIYVFDRRKELPASYPIREMAQDTARTFQAAGLREPSVLGVSQGGMIAMELAIEHPNLVRKLALCSTSARVTEAQYQTIETWIRFAKDRNAADLYQAFGEALFPQDVFEQSRQLLADAAKSVTDEDLNRFVILAEGVKGFDIADDLETIACPVLAIGSRDDRVLGENATVQIAEHLGNRPDFALHMYDGYGHAAYDTAPDFKERILRFLLPR